MTPPRMYHQLRCFLPAKKVNTAIKLYNHLIEWDKQKYAVALGKTNGLPWASITKMCELMGWKDERRQRQTIAELKKALRKAMLIHFTKLFEVGKKLADTFMFLTEKPKAVIFAGEETLARRSRVNVVVVPREHVSLVDYFRGLMAS